MCREIQYLFFVLMLFHQEFSYAQNSVSFATSAEKELFQSQDYASIIAIQAFTSSVTPSILSTSKADTFYDTHLQSLSAKINSKDSNKRKAAIIFDYLHNQVFNKYELEALVPHLINNNTYNCVTATALFVSYAEAFQIPYKIYETPAHVYASVIDKDKEIFVELTAPKIGYDLKLDYETMVQILVSSKLISRDEVANKGAKQVYQEHIRDTKVISKRELLAIQYHNNGLVYAKQKQYTEAYNQMNKAIALYPNQTFSKAYSYIASISQLDFTIETDKKYELLRSMLNSTKTDSLLTYSLVNHLGELTEDLLKNEESFEKVQSLLEEVEKNIVLNDFIKSKLDEYRVYMFTVFAQNASLRGNTISAKNNLQKAIDLAPNNDRLVTFYVSAASSYASKLSQSGLFDRAKEVISELGEQYKSGYPIITETKVQIILDSLVPIPKTLENKDHLILNLKNANQLSPENIYLQSFAADIFHELAMQP